MTEMSSSDESVSVQVGKVEKNVECVDLESSELSRSLEVFLISSRVTEK